MFKPEDDDKDKKKVHDIDLSAAKIKLDKNFSKLIAEMSKHAAYSASAIAASQKESLGAMLAANSLKGKTKMISKKCLTEGFDKKFKLYNSKNEFVGYEIHTVRSIYDDEVEKKYEHISVIHSSPNGSFFGWFKNSIGGMDDTGDLFEVTHVTKMPFVFHDSLGKEVYQGDWVEWEALPEGVTISDAGEPFPENIKYHGQIIYSDQDCSYYAACYETEQIYQLGPFRSHMKWSPTPAQGMPNEKR